MVGWIGECRLWCFKEKSNGMFVMAVELLKPDRPMPRKMIMMIKVHHHFKIASGLLRGKKWDGSSSMLIEGSAVDEWMR